MTNERQTIGKLQQSILRRDHRIETLMERVRRLEIELERMKAQKLEARDNIEETIHEVVTKFHPYTWEQLKSPSRLREIVISRQIHQYFIHKYTTYTLKQIGGLFGNRDHSTVLHSIQAVKDQNEINRKYAAELAEMNNYILKLIA